MEVKEIMTKKTVKSCSPETKLKEAAEIMKTVNCGVLPVTDRNKKVVGIITDRDICLAISHDNKVAHGEIPVNDIMEKDVHTVKETDDVAIALERMRINYVGRLPVVDNDDKLTGIISLHTLAAHAFEEKIDLGKSTEEGENIMKTFEALTACHSNSEQTTSQENSILHAL